MTAPLEETALAPHLEKLLLVSPGKRLELKAILRTMPPFPGQSADLTCYYLRPGINGKPDVPNLTAALLDHIVEFALRHADSELVGPDRSRVTRKAMKLLIQRMNDGEGGELLLFMILDAMFRFPKMVAKLSLKTDTQMASFGADGLHATWGDDGKLELVIGESKIYKDPKDGIRDAFASARSHMTGQELERELNLYIDYPSFDDEGLKAAVRAFVRGDAGPPTLSIAILVGFTWFEYEALLSNGFGAQIEKIEQAYQAAIPELQAKVLEHHSKFELPRPRCRVFLLPFQDVKDFRRAILEEQHAV